MAIRFYDERTCGCPWEYHMSDCPLVVPNTPLDEGDEAARFYGEEF